MNSIDTLSQDLSLELLFAPTEPTTITEAELSFVSGGCGAIVMG